MKVAIGYLTKDRVELSERSIISLLQPDKFRLFVFDGSATEAGCNFPYRISMQEKHRSIHVHANVVGGPDAAVAYALTTMLKGTDHEYIGLCENDVLLHPDWFGPTSALFERGRSDGLDVGAVSARCYEDRVLIQRDGYAICHNLGWGMQILTRKAAQLALAHMRTSITTENRRLFCQLSGIDVGTYWAFRATEGHLCADWGNDRLLASHGLASLALTPSPVEMIGQVPPMHEQGLKLVDKPVDLLRNDAAFATFAERTNQVRTNSRTLFRDSFLFEPGVGWTIFAHQVAQVGARYVGDWRLKWQQGFGPFGWKAGDIRWTDAAHERATKALPAVTIPLSGPVEFLVSGGDTGGQFEIEDLSSGYTCHPALPAHDLVSLPCPASVAYRDIRLTALTPGVVFYGVRSREPQPVISGQTFTHDMLPPV